MRIDWSRYRIDLHEMGRSRWLRGIRIPRDLFPDFTMPDHDLWVAARGTGRVRLHSGWRILKPGSCLWIRPGIPYRVEQDPEDPFSLHYFHFDLVDADGRKYPANAPLPPEIIEPPDGAAAGAIAHRIVDLCFGFSAHGDTRPPYPEPARTIAFTLLTGLLMELDAASSTSPPTRLTHRQETRIRQAAIRIAENPAEHIAVAELAKEAGYSRSHFSRLFERLTGQTPERYAVHVRLSRASQLLTTTTLPVGEIAERLGYQDIYFFSQQFKKFKGMSPLAWRRQPPAAP